MLIVVVLVGNVVVALERDVLIMRLNQDGCSRPVVPDRKVSISTRFQRCVCHHQLRSKINKIDLHVVHVLVDGAAVVLVQILIDTADVEDRIDGPNDIVEVLLIVLFYFGISPRLVVIVALLRMFAVTVTFAPGFLVSAAALFARLLMSFHHHFVCCCVSLS